MYIFNDTLNRIKHEPTHTSLYVKHNSREYDIIVDNNKYIIYVYITMYICIYTYTYINIYIYIYIYVDISIKGILRYTICTYTHIRRSTANAVRATANNIELQRAVMILLARGGSTGRDGHVFITRVSADMTIQTTAVTNSRACTTQWSDIKNAPCMHM